MSTSSSTIRMSCAIVYRTHRVVEFHWPEDQADLGAPAFPIFQNNFTAMVFHDFLNNGKAQSGPFRSCRDIGLGQTVAHRLGEAAAIVFHRDGPAALSFEKRHRDLALAPWGFRFFLGGKSSLDGVF